MLDVWKKRLCDSAGKDWKKALDAGQVAGNVMLLERLVAVILQAGQSLSIRYWLTGLWSPKYRRLFVEGYALTVLVMVTIVLFSGQKHFWMLPVGGVIAYLLAEGYVASLAVILIPDGDGSFGIASARRALILLVLNYASIAVGFAALYQLTGTITYSYPETAPKTPMDFLYFSIVTITTLGYGDMRPTGQGRQFVCVEALSGLFLLVLILAAILPELQRKGEKS